MTRSVVVVGGGVSGLTVAHRLAGRAEVTLVEPGHVGGKVLTTTLDGIRFEAGPDSFLAREPWVTDLCAELGLGDQLIAPAVFGAVIAIGNKLRRAPGDFAFGMPATPLASLRSRILSPLGALRAGADLVLPGPLRGPDVSVGAFVRRRFGREVLARLVDPLLAGTRAGLPTDISLAAALPQIDALARRHRSVTVGLSRARRAGAQLGATPPFLTLRSGMCRLPEVLAQRVAERAEVLAVACETIERLRGRFRVRLDAGEAVEATDLVLAVPAHVAAELLAGVNPEAAATVSTIRYASVAVAGLVFPPGGFDPPADSSGLLVPTGAGRALAAATWLSRKWPHTAPADGRVVVKCFAGRGPGDPAVDLDDEALLEAMRRDLAELVGGSAAPLTSTLVRWPRGLPLYSVGHLDRVTRAEAELAATPGLHLAGAGYRGSGLPDCVRRAEEVAATILGGPQPDAPR